MSRRSRNDNKLRELIDICWEMNDKFVELIDICREMNDNLQEMIDIQDLPTLEQK
ncbi:hypothetical protein [Sporosarcina koreensis]|uniref:hypothetical protein n=1 Tax=Sporosarcina koreensis TaxID=334735 RepID=UPI0013667DAA|nr:hypothetical protein [Sporosarcina koreensis]